MRSAAVVTARRRVLRKLCVALLLLTGVISGTGCDRTPRERASSEQAEPQSRPSTSPADPATRDRQQLDIAYSARSASHRLDVYLPEGGGPHPVIVFVHGGGYVGGDKRDGQERPVLQARERGYAVVSINYRLLSEADFPAQVHDVKAAVRWVRANADAYGFDSERIALWGGSAGAHLALLAALEDDVEALDDRGFGNGSRSSSVQAVVDWFGPVDFRLMHRHLKARSTPETQTAGLRYLSKMIATSPDLVDIANPIAHVSESDPPVLIQHGDLDDTVPVIHSRMLAEAMLEKYGPRRVKLSVIEGAGHGGPEFYSGHNIAMILNFLDDSLGR